MTREAAPETRFVHLTGSRERLAGRLTARLDHVTPPSLLDTQLTSREPPSPDESGTTVEVASAPDRIAAEATDARTLTGS